MKKIIIALIVVLLSCSCATETGLCFDMRVVKSTPKLYDPSVELREEEPSQPTEPGTYRVYGW